MDSLLVLIVAVAVLAVFANLAVTFGQDSRDGFTVSEGGLLR
jgi:hypothetical protein